MGKRRDFLINTAIVSIGGLSLPSRIIKKNTSDLLGCDRTTTDYFGEGPFYTVQPPFISNNLLAKKEEPGTRLILSGRIFNLECSEFLPSTVIDIWHADSSGHYDNDGYNLRGFTKTNAQGFYLFETILPGKYKNGSDYRPAHIHLKIKPPSHPPLTTQVYFEGDEKIPTDKSASISSGEYDATHRIISLHRNTEGKLEGQFDIVINGSGKTVAQQDLHLNTGMIYKASHNTEENSVEIQYGVFKPAKVGLYVYDIKAQQVAVLYEKNRAAEKYEATWKPEPDLPSGHYFITIKINDLEVHHLKIFKK